MSSSDTRYTPTQLRGVTNTSDAEPDPEYLTESRPTSSEGAWTEDLDTAIYGDDHLIIPGEGSEGPDCGTWYPKEFCDTQGHVNLGEHQCGNRACPRCWSHLWARPRTVNVVSRLGAAREAQHPRAVHVVASPPEGSVSSLQEFYDAHRTAYEIAKDHGVRGGVLIPHAYRITDEAKRAFRAEVETGKWEPEEDGGIWRWVREHDTDWRDLTYWSPHFHIVGLGRDIAQGNSEADDGWVFKNVKRGDSYSLTNWRKTDPDAYDDMASVVRYLLSHTTFDEDENRQVVRWFGELHSTKFDPESELSKGTWDTIQRHAEEVVGGEGDRSDGGGGDPERETCDRDGCDGDLYPIWDARDFLDQRGDRLDDAAYDRVMSAYLWATGDIQPPPGLKHPRTERHAREAFEALLE